eukprot:scaffold60418_cov56-Phaeocystis_antarctica.AAC.3
MGTWRDRNPAIATLPVSRSYRSKGTRRCAKRRTACVVHFAVGHTRSHIFWLLVKQPKQDYTPAACIVHGLDTGRSPIITPNRAHQLFRSRKIANGKIASACAWVWGCGPQHPRTIELEARASGDRGPCCSHLRRLLRHEQRLELREGAAHAAVERVDKNVDLVDRGLAGPRELVAVLPQ